MKSSLYTQILFYIKWIKDVVANKTKRVRDVVANKIISDSKWRSIRQKILEFSVLDFASILKLILLDL